MNKLIENIRLSFVELREKVTWPSWEQLQESAVITLVASLVIAMLVFVMDVAFENVFKVFYQLFQ